MKPIYSVEGVQQSFFISQFVRDNSEFCMTHGHLHVQDAVLLCGPLKFNHEADFESVRTEEHSNKRMRLHSRSVHIYPSLQSILDPPREAND